MARAVLVTVPDEGAAWMVRDALGEAGIDAEVERAVPEHPYVASALARPMRVFVPEGDLERARKIMAALEAELAHHEDELAAEALAAGRLADEPAPDEKRLDERKRPRLSWAIALGVLLPLPAVCFYARAPRLGALFMGAFLFGIGHGLYHGVWLNLGSLFDTGWYLDAAPNLLIAPVAKLVDLALGIVVVTWNGRRGSLAEEKKADIGRN